MAMLNRTFAHLYSEVTRFIKNGDTPSGDDTTNAKRWANEGYWEFLNAFPWSFLSPNASITLWPTTTTGAVTVGGTGNKTLTVAAATFYPSMVGKAIVGNSTLTSYTIDSYVSALSVTVTASALGDAGATFTITADGTYALPAGFSGLIDRFTCNDRLGYGPLDESTPEQIRWLRSNAETTGDPQMFAVVAHDFTNTTGQLFDLMTWPTPDTVRVLNYRYQLTPGEMTADAEYPVGGPAFSMAILTAALMVAERRTNRTATVYRDLFYGTEQAPGHLAAAIKADSRVRPAILGMMSNDYPVLVVKNGALTEIEA